MKCTTTQMETEKQKVKTIKTKLKEKFDHVDNFHMRLKTKRKKKPYLPLSITTINWKLTT